MSIIVKHSRVVVQKYRTIYVTTKDLKFSRRINGLESSQEFNRVNGKLENEVTF
jgi:hypothetical protein